MSQKKVRKVPLEVRRALNPWEVIRFRLRKNKRVCRVKLIQVAITETIQSLSEVHYSKCMTHAPRKINNNITFTFSWVHDHRAEHEVLRRTWLICVLIVLVQFDNWFLDFLWKLYARLIHSAMISCAPSSAITNAWRVSIAIKLNIFQCFCFSPAMMAAIDQVHRSVITSSWYNNIIEPSE